MEENMNEMLNDIKIRKLVLVCIVVTFGMIGISELPPVKKITVLDSNFWVMIIDTVFLIWFVFKILKRKIRIKPLIDNFKENTNFLQMFMIMLVNAVLSLGFIMCIAFAAYKINPDLMTELLNDSSKGTNGSFISIVYSCIAASFIAPIIEEIMFRGVILGRLKKRWKTVPAIIVSSLIFALLHYQVAFFGAFFFGVIMCLLYLKTGNILINICIHFINNFIISVINIVTYSPAADSINSNFSSGEVNIIGIAGLVLLIISGFFTIKYIIKSYTQLKAQSV
jgi:membrane protease YdiL (CAAX protease family)